MRRILPVLTALVLAGALPAQASTLDPSHPIWSQPGTDRAAWIRALQELRAEQAPLIKTHQPELARGQLAAVGLRVLVIPVLPADAPGAPRTQQELEALWSGPGEGSVRGYWEFVSAGEMSLEVQVLPWLQVPGTLQTDYPNVINGNPANLSAGPRNLARDALTAAARVVEDLHVFDDDGPDQIPGSGDDDGVLDLVVVLHPFVGWETDPANVPRAIVSVQSRLTDPVIQGLDLRADAFVVTSALGPLGVWVHEFGHLLGLPDLYDQDRNAVAGTPGTVGPQGGLGRWSLMASGTWGGGGALPSGLDAWSRDRLGFGETTVRDDGGTVVLPWVDATQARALRLDPLGDWQGESFLLEARRPRPNGIVDAALPGAGALVYRVRPDLSANAIATKFLELLQADGLADLDHGTNDGDAGDPWTGTPPADRLDGNSNPSSTSALPGPGKTPPSFGFLPAATGIRVDYALADAAALRLESFGILDSYSGLRSWMRPAESGRLDMSWSDAGATQASTASVLIQVRPEGRAIEVLGPNPVPLRLEGGSWVIDAMVELSDPGLSTEVGLALLDLEVTVDGSTTRTVALGLPIRFSDGIAPDALARFGTVIHAAGADTTRFAQMPFADLPSPAIVGYELVTDGFPGYAPSMDLSFESSWFAVPTEQLAWVWTRGMTERDLPGQAFDGAVIEAYRPDRGWQAVLPQGPPPVWISRRSGAATRDQFGFGGAQPTWESWSLPLPAPVLPVRLRVRFASDASGPAGWWQVAGLQTNVLPRAEITLGTQALSGSITALARLSGDFSRVNLVQYRYRSDPLDPWKPASGIFSVVSSQVFTLVLSQLPVDVERAQIGLFSGNGAAAWLLGETGFRRTPESRLPRILSNPATGKVVLQQEDFDAQRPISVYDLRGRRSARFSIPAHTTWYEWEPRSENGALLASGKYFLRVDGEDLGTLAFTWFR